MVGIGLQPVGSRARDRMYLVRLVKLGELSMTDVRRTLVEHFSAPLEGVEGDRTLIDLANLASSAMFTPRWLTSATESRLK